MTGNTTIQQSLIAAERMIAVETVCPRVICRASGTINGDTIVATVVRLIE